jgi:uncharacterized membrane protein
MSNNKTLLIIIWILVIASFVLAAYFYPTLPANIVSHWNALGQPNGYMSKTSGLFLFPVIDLVLVLLFMLILKIDPLRENIKQFSKYYYGFIAALLIFMLLIQSQVSLWNYGVKINTNIVVPIALGILFFYVGILLQHAKRNWFIGIRTPWTLSNEAVWDKTNRLGGRLFKACGIISVISIFFGEYALIITISFVMAIAIFLVVYSYIEFTRVERIK